MRDYFGAPLLSEGERRTLEQSLCTGEHKSCHLYYTQGDDEPGRRLKGYAAAQRRNALQQAEKNREAYEADAVRHRASIVRLTARIRNAMLAYLQPTVVRTASAPWTPAASGGASIWTMIRSSPRSSNPTRGSWQWTCCWTPPLPRWTGRPWWLPKGI